jgi:hypothetical protein
MVDVASVEAQLKRIKFNWKAWGRAEAKELPHILHPDEKVYECVNGIYDGGFALLVSTDMRVLLIDKKPLNYLTVEDLRFDMINEIDYNHRLMGAKIRISAGSKTLQFMSFNQSRLRKLIGHVQDRMSEIKKEATEHQENQKQHLAQINQQLQAYLLAQHQQLMQMQQAQAQGANANQIQPIKPSPELADYLFAQSLLQQVDMSSLPSIQEEPAAPTQVVEQTAQTAPATNEASEPVRTDDLVEAGREEIFGKPAQPASQPQRQEEPQLANYLDLPEEKKMDLSQIAAKTLEINPLKIASAKLPMMLRNRKFGRPSLREHSQNVPQVTQQQPQTVTQP